MPAVLFGDVEAWLTGFYTAELATRTEPVTDGVWVGNDLAKAPPTTRRRILVRDDGGPVLGDVRAVARIGVQVWAGTHADSSDLANLASALLAGAADGKPVVRVSTTRPYSVPDEGEQHKHYFTAELVVRGVSL